MGRGQSAARKARKIDLGRSHSTAEGEIYIIPLGRREPWIVDERDENNPEYQCMMAEQESGLSIVDSIKVGQPRPIRREADETKQSLSAIGATIGPERLQELIAKLPPAEAETLTLYFDSANRTQSEIGELCHITQAAVSYRLIRAIERLRWYAGIGSRFSADDIRRDLSQVMLPPDVHLLASFWDTGNYSETQRRLGLQGSNSQTRSRIRSLIRTRLRDYAAANPALAIYHQGFLAMLTDGLRKMARTRASRWWNHATKKSA